MKRVAVLFFTLLLALGYIPGHAQLLKKLKDKANSVSNKVLDPKDKTSEEKPPATEGDPDFYSTKKNTNENSRGQTTNETGSGLRAEDMPDVNTKLNEADTSYRAGNFSETRYYLEAALKGLEMQMGKVLLRSLPASVLGLAADSTKDIVSCSKAGWTNMFIKRLYYKDKQELRLTIGTNSENQDYVIYKSYFSDPTMAQNGEVNFKQIRVKGRKAIIEYNKSEGYTLCIESGQAPMIMFKGVNFANEDALMAAVNSFDIEGIYKMTGIN